MKQNNDLAIAYVILSAFVGVVCVALAYYLYNLFFIIS